MAASECPECISGRETAAGFWRPASVDSGLKSRFFGRTGNFGAPGSRLSPIGVASGFSYLNPANSSFSGQTQRGPSEMPRFRNFSSSVALALGLVLGFACSLSFGGELNARGRKELQAIEQVIQQNFEASNREDVKGVMATMTPVIPQQERFVEELRQFFKDVDCYTRLVSVEPVSAEMTEDGLRAVVRVVQETTTGKDGEDLPYSEFRERSTMLPPWPLCEYEMVLYKVRNKWLIYECDGQPREVTREGLAARSGAQD